MIQTETDNKMYIFVLVQYNFSYFLIVSFLHTENQLTFINNLTECRSMSATPWKSVSIKYLFNYLPKTNNITSNWFSVVPTWPLTVGCCCVSVSSLASSSSSQPRHSSQCPVSSHLLSPAQTERALQIFYLIDRFRELLFVGYQLVFIPVLLYCTVLYCTVLYCNTSLFH